MITKKVQMIPGNPKNRNPYYVGKFLRIFIFVFLVQLNYDSFSQVKFEREYKIGENEVPDKALNFINESEVNSQINWFREESEDGISIEAKFKNNGKLYSVEFSESGEIQDIEIIARKKEIPKEVWEILDENLTTEFDKYGIMKIQTQFTGESAGLLKLLKEGAEDHGCILKYEIIIKSVVEKEWSKYEILADDEGNILQVKKLIVRNTDNLEY
ncbi:hypothetical protein [Mangrovivirga cuniculi]|uniref:PepSY domain-containing protein n=1 Tax=Mangrovivirga cuniculi TaxID=2715131 RepID=A0A4D7JDS6_9BACT|nr:hypothetical protein [Mangrovivirga cuniculi]QCK14439.1 hypothetical protein DCC35_06640 [Mangrovivirga cuniculi]